MPILEPTTQEELDEANKLLRQWLDWFNRDPGKLYMAPSGMTRLHLVKATEIYRREESST